MSLFTFVNHVRTNQGERLSQVNGSNIRNVENEFGHRWLYSPVDLWLWHGAVSLLLLFGYWLIIQLAAYHLLHTMPIVSMVRVGGVEERELRVLTLVLADFVLELRGIRRPGNKRCCPVDDG